MFYSIFIFRDSIGNLCKKEKDGYHSCRNDICDLLKSRSFDEIWAMNTLLREMPGIRLIKLRVKNSFQNISSADGFRLIICCNRKYQTVTFLNVYAKRGKLAMMDQSKEEYKRQLKIYLEDLKNSNLQKHDIQNLLVPVV